MWRRVAWWAVVVSGWVVAGYGLALAVLGDRMYPPDLAESFRAHAWGIGTHAGFGALAMVLGPWQFRRGPGWHRGRHRWIGRGYLIACGLSGGAGLYLAPYTFGGMTTHLGFGSLAVVLLLVSSLGFLAIRQRRVDAHREWMIRSYALIFAAVTLRFELPLLSAALGDFLPAYRIIAWMCWVPNLLAAEWYIRRTRTAARATLPTLELPVAVSAARPAGGAR
ncbi:MAG: DUF2306 domain-containing protein [Gemmatimonadales bacterium]